MRKKNGSALFLMELIIIILFFSLASAVCINLFVSAHLKTKASENITKAVFYSQSLAEVHRSLEGDVSRMSEFFPEYTACSDTQFQLSFDKNWQTVSSDGRYFVTLLVTDSSALQTSVITTTDSDGNVIFELPLTVYTPN